MTASTARTRLPSAAMLLAGQVRYHLRLLLATPGALAIGVGLPVLLLVADGARHSRTSVSGVAGYAVMGLTMTAWNTHGMRLVISRESGILRRWRASPLPPWCYFTAAIATTALFATLTGAITFGAGVLLDGVHVSAGAAAAGIAVMLLGALAWAGLATALAGIVPTAPTAQPTFVLIYFLVLTVSGAFGTLTALPHWLLSLARYLPAQPLIDAVARAFGHASGAPYLPARDVLVLAVWAAAGLLAAVALFRWDPHRPAQRRAARPAT
jgi:ABC-2 type transport system permease protein